MGMELEMGTGTGLKMEMGTGMGMVQSRNLPSACSRCCTGTTPMIPCRDAGRGTRPSHTQGCNHTAWQQQRPARSSALPLGRVHGFHSMENINCGVLVRFLLI